MVANKKKQDKINDAMQKYVMNIFERGDNPLQAFKIQAAGFKEPVMNEEPLRLSHRIDYAFIDEEDVLHSVEFESSFNRKDVVRFLLYHATLAYNHRDKVKYVSLYVVYAGHIKPRPVEQTQMLHGSVIFKPVVIFLHDFYAEDELKSVLEREHKHTLSNNDVSTLIFSLLMNRRGSFTDIAQQVFNIAKEIKDTKRKEEVIGNIKAYVEKYMKESEQIKLEEVIRMTFEEMLKESKEEGKEEILCHLITKKLRKGSSPEEIADEFDLDITKVNSLIEKFKLSK